MNPSQNPVRLNKLLADAGICSRRKADELIESGFVKVNGQVVTQMGAKVTPQVDVITVKGKKLSSKEEKLYFAFNKPKNVITSTSDPEGRRVILEYFQKYKKYRLFPVGRLDWASEGLIFVTNDGEFANAIANPQSHIPKTYMVKINGKIKPEQIEKLKTGVTIIGGKVKALKAEVIPYGKSAKYDWVKLTITEGKNRQIRKMFEKLGFDVKKLTRISIGEYKLGSLKVGQAVPLKSPDLLKIFKKKSSTELKRTHGQKKVRSPKVPLKKSD